MKPNISFSNVSPLLPLNHSFFQHLDSYLIKLIFTLVYIFASDTNGCGSLNVLWFDDLSLRHLLQEKTFPVTLSHFSSSNVWVSFKL